ncbi:MAG: phosphate acyltransferase PlsX, partial [Anaerolineae bacterium]|nr:phosphate acyltransferase PlsX [Anaerolineae bacterium]
MRIAVDAMGSDENPKPDVGGSVLAAREYGYTILMVGDKQTIESELEQHEVSGLNVEVVHAEEAVTMEDKPTSVGKSKPGSSMHIGMGLVRDGHADAFVSMGNTGAALAIATLHTLRRIPGVKRPALSGVYPLSGKRLVILDVGANADSKPEWLVQFALMGSIYANRVLGIASPKVALLSNGEEEGKGNADIKAASATLRELSSMNYIGNIEPKEIVGGVADVIVADGFVGNIFVKTFEASTSFLS